MGQAATLGGSALTLDADRGVTEERERSEVPVARGALVGRYVVLSHLGRGAMGVVVAAYDPELDRRVALKLLRPHRQGSTGRARLQREALALARLNHPNVVGVHDVGVHAGHVFVAMELVAGRTLRQWMDETPRPRRWQDVLPVFEDAARGLAAAHRAGLVHRDFKPENVMVGDDGRVRVMDFGLARPGDSADSARPSDSIHSGSGPSEVLSGSLTQTGTLIGTPAYMAPEQFSNAVAGPHSDQFSVCVALFEALYGARPFQGETPGEIAYAVTNGQLRRVPGERRVPTWVHRAVLRGLSQRAADRFESMDALASALAAGEARGRRRRRGAALLGVGAVAAMGLGWQRWHEQQLVEHCVRAGDAIDPVWSPSRRAAVAEGIGASDLLYAKRVGEAVLPALDRYAQRWRKTAEAACTARTIEHSWTADRADRARWCLDMRLAHMDALAEALERSTPGTIRQAITTVAGWSPPEECTEALHLDVAPEPPPSQVRADAVLLLQELVDIGLRIERNDAEAASLMADGAVRRADEIGWAPLRAHARVMKAHAASLLKRFDQAEGAGIDAYMLAGEAGAWKLASMAANVLVYVIGHDPARLEEARTWAGHARLANANGGFDRPHVQARVEDNLGVALRQAGRFDEARRHYERALELTSSDLGPESPLTHWPRFHLAEVHFAEGDFAAAKQRYEQALAVLADSHGPDHPTGALMMAGIGEAALRLGAPEEAEDRLLSALRVWRRAGNGEASIARVQILLGATQRQLGKLDVARDTLEDSIRVYTSIRGARHPDVTHPMAQLAGVLEDLGQLERATELQEEALSIRVEALGPDHELVGVSHLALGQLATRRGETEAAITHLKRAVSLVEDGYGARHPNTATAHLRLGEAFEAKGELPRAAAEVQRGLDILTETLGSDHPAVESAREVLDRIVHAEATPQAPS